MNLQILNNQGTFEIHGDFIEGNTDKVRQYFDNLLDRYYEIVICLKQVKRIDNSGLSVMKFITQKATKRSKTLFVLGDQNKRIIKKFKNANLSTIFKNDYTS
ncbi:hypothetical protein A9Q86_15030 [Flavobacteriales bacterium 33_180_T64]|nr:hypothetical protein A9Q86_15030 [Flavobacteriales bacterium 33_180_T64]